MVKLFFLKEDSYYKIVKTLEKIPAGRDVEIFIEEKNQFFLHNRRAKQVKDIIEQRKLNVIFVAKNESTKNYFIENNLEYSYNSPEKWREVITVIYNFIFDAKQFHIQLFTKKSYAFYVIFGIELALIAGIVFFISSILIPSATIVIKPSYTMEDIVYNFRYHEEGDKRFNADNPFLGIPYKKGFIQYTWSMSTDGKNINYFQNPSHGTVEFTNKLPNNLSLLSKTKLISSDGILYQIKNSVNIPAANKNTPGKVRVEVEAMEVDDQKKIIGVRGNIKSGTVLTIKNLKSSFILKEVFANAINNFSGGKTRSQSLITSGDIEILKQKLTDHVKQNKKAIATKYFDLKDGYLLRFDDLINVSIDKIEVKNKPGDVSHLVEGSIEAKVNYKYVAREDLKKAVDKYISQRPSDNLQLISIDKKSLIFFDKSSGDNMMIIPTKISTVWGYDFNEDKNNLQDEIKGKIIGSSIEDTREILLTYPDIGDVSVITTPPRYNTIPLLKSRIYFEIQNPLSGLE